MFNKLLAYNSLYDRVYLRVELNTEDDQHMKVIANQNVSEIIIPMRQAATFFLDRDDLLVIDQVEEVKELNYVDYQLVDDVKYRDSFSAFTLLANLSIETQKNFILQIKGRIVYKDILIISATHERGT